MSYWQSSFDKGLTLYTKYSDLLEVLVNLKRLKLGPEIVFEDTTALLILSSKEIADVKRILDKDRLPRTVHAPFYDLSLGSVDQHIREYSAKCLTRGLEIAADLGSSLYIMHSGFWPMIPQDSKKLWINVFLQEMEKLIKKAQKLEVEIALENVFETDLWLHETAFDHFNNSELSMCFDLGHANCFSSVSPMRWVDTFNNRIVHIHIHDNDGSDDQHLPLGRGTVNFAGVFGRLQKYGVKPTIDLETNPEETSACISFLENLLLN